MHVNTDSGEWCGEFTRKKGERIARKAKSNTRVNYSTVHTLLVYMGACGVLEVPEGAVIV